jgi:hypothetical protein
MLTQSGQAVRSSRKLFDLNPFIQVVLMEGANPQRCVAFKARSTLTLRHLGVTVS